MPRQSVMIVQFRRLKKEGGAGRNRASQKYKMPRYRRGRPKRKETFKLCVVLSSLGCPKATSLRRSGKAEVTPDRMVLGEICCAFQFRAD